MRVSRGCFKLPAMTVWQSGDRAISPRVRNSPVIATFAYRLLKHRMNPRRVWGLGNGRFYTNISNSRCEKSQVNVHIRPYGQKFLRERSSTVLETEVPM